MMRSVAFSAYALKYVAGDSCADFNGVAYDHNANVCCAAACGSYCGAIHCDDGPGGGDSCCKSHITKNGQICGVAASSAPCMLPSVPSPTPSPSPEKPVLIDDDFSSRNETTWVWADHEYVDQFAPGYYLKNHSVVNASLSLGEGQGMVLTMSKEPCDLNTVVNCKGANMASAHVQANVEHSFGDYEARFRAPHVPGGNTCPDGIYGYFTAGYSKHDGVQNEINFGLHPDRDNGGTVISCESHADTGSYKETKVALGFNYRAGFHTYLLRLRPTYVEWFVDGKSVHKVEEKLSHTMHTSFILRTNKAGEMATAIMEFSHFAFTPYHNDVEIGMLV